MMKKMKKLLAGCAVVLTLAATAVTAFAADYKTPAEAVAGLTGLTAEEVESQRQGGKGYGAIAAEAGKLAEYHAAVLELRKETLDADVAAGRLTRDRADALYAAAEDRQALCDGTGCLGDGSCGLHAGHNGQGCADGTCTLNGGGCGNGTGTGRGGHHGGSGTGHGSHHNW